MITFRPVVLFLKRIVTVLRISLALHCIIALYFQFFLPQRVFTTLVTSSKSHCGGPPGLLGLLTYVFCKERRVSTEIVWETNTSWMGRFIILTIFIVMRHPTIFYRIFYHVRLPRIDSQAAWPLLSTFLVYFFLSHSINLYVTFLPYEGYLLIPVIISLLCGVFYKDKVLQQNQKCTIDSVHDWNCNTCWFFILGCVDELDCFLS